MTILSSSSMESTPVSTLGSFPRGGVAIVFGAGGGIGGAFVERLRCIDGFEQVLGFSRKSSPSIDLLDEASLQRAATLAAAGGQIRLVVALAVILIASGFQSVNALIGPPDHERHDRK